MAYAFVQSGANNSSTSGAITAGSITVTAGNALIVWICTSTTGTQTLSGNGNTYTFVASSTPVSDSLFLSAYIVQNANGGATAVATTDTGAFAIYVAEYSGLAQSGGSLGFINNNQASFGAGANIITSNATGSITAPAVAFAMCVDVAGIQSGSPNSGTITAGNTLAWTSRTTTWNTGSSVMDALAEDIEIGVTGTITATFGTTGNKQFTGGITALFALAELSGGGSPTATIAWTT